MQCQTLVGGGLVLLLLGACGDDDSLVCGEGTQELDGECIALSPDAGADLNSPADRRLCDSFFGPVGASALFVDAAYTGTDSDGSQERPFTTIQPAISAATAGQEIGIAAGNYAGDLTIESSLSLEGRCANEVIIDGSIHVQDTGGVAIRGLTVRNGSPGILADDVQPEPGEDFGLQLRFVRATQNDGAGIEMNASAVAIADSEFTLTREVAGGDLRQLGSGLFVNDGSRFDVSASIVSMNGFMAIDVADATGQPLAILADTTPKAAPTSPSSGIVSMNGIIGNAGGGIRVGAAPSGLLVQIGPPSIEILGNDFSANGGDAISVFSTGIAIAGNTLEGGVGSRRGIRIEASTGSIANNQVDGFAQGGLDLSESRGIAIAGNTIINNVEFGIQSFNSKGISMSGNTIRNTKSGPNLPTGHGVYVFAAEDINKVGQYDLTGNIVSDNDGVGIAINNLDLGNSEERVVTMFGNTVARNALMGIDLRDTRALGMSGNALIDNVGYGIRCVNGPGSASRVFFDDNVVKGTSASGTGLDGDGVLMSNCHVSVDLNEILGNARNGIVMDDGTDGSCDDNQVTGHGLGDAAVHDILRQNSGMPANGNIGADIADGIVNLNLVPIAPPGI